MYRRNTAGQTLGFRLVNAASGASLTGASVSAYRCIDGGAQAPADGAVAEKGNGQYVFSPSAADLNGAQISYLFLATGAVPEEKTVLTTAANPADAQRFGLGALPNAGTLLVKPAVTLAEADVTGELPANAVQLAGQAVAASAGVAFPAAVASQTNAPTWYDTPAIAQAVWDALHSALGDGATLGQAVPPLLAFRDAWTAETSTVLSPPPTVNGFTVDVEALSGAVRLPAVVAINADGLRGIAYRVTSFNPNTGAVVLRDALPVSPPTDVSVPVEFASDLPRSIDLAQPIADVQTPTVGGALAASWTGYWGKMIVDKVAKILRLWGPGNNTNSPSYNFSLDDPDDPSNRTPLA
ncbi:MAG: hypothetical protein U0790_00170 [Isosphaeraceae bacterium]